MGLDAIGARPVSSKTHGPSAALAVPAEPRYPLAGSGFQRLGPAPCKSGKKPCSGKGPLCSPSRLQPQSQCFTHRGAALHSLAAIPKSTTENLWGSKTLKTQEMIMKTIASALMALTVLTGFAAGALAYNPDAHDAKQFFEQQQREAR